MEDHTSLIGEGLKHDPLSSGVKTFDKSELCAILNEVGLTDYTFYYPYPDYKLPMQIYSDDYLPKVGELSQNYNNLDQERVEVFREKDGFDFAITHHLFPEVSNSFLVVALGE